MATGTTEVTPIKVGSETPETPATPETDLNDHDFGKKINLSVIKEQEKKSNFWIYVYCLLAVTILMIILNCVLIGLLVSKKDDDDNNYNNNDESISVDTIEGFDNYLKSHCILHIDTDSAEEMDPFGEGITVIRNPIDIPSPINIAYTPLINDTSGSIEYFDNLDSNGNLVAKPLCQTDFDNSTYTMKGNNYAFDTNLCEFPLPSWMTEEDILSLPRRTEKITHRIVLTTVEVVAELESGHTFEFFTYNATIPGPPIRVRVGDWIDLTLINPNTSAHEHSVDFHGMSGPGGGAVSLRVNPGEVARTIWQAIIPGMFIYHCASGWISYHISKGMYGAIIVEPENGLPYSDMDVYLGQNELYLHYPLINNMATKFAIPKPNIHNEFDTIKERYELDDVVMLNGAPFALVHNPIITFVGSIVRAFIVSGGPNTLSSFHIIGDHFDRVWLHADFNTSPQQNIQTTTVPPGGCSVTDWRHDTPGEFIFVDHALTRAFVKGNLGIIRACNRNDTKCINWSSGSSVGNKYCCNPQRYSNNSDIDILTGNDDCVFCPWSRTDISGKDTNEETDEIYNYLHEQCKVDSDNTRFDKSNVKWQGDESRYNDTVSEVINDWRKNRYPGIDQWSLSDDLQLADAMVGNPRRVIANYSNDDDETESFDGKPCIVNAGSDDSMSIYYIINNDGDGFISITTLRSNLIDGGWIAFGRGGDGISTMKDSHIIAVLFDYDDNIEVVNLYIQGYETPILDNNDDNLIFPASNISLNIINDEISFMFNVSSGDWIESSSALSTIPLIIGMGEISDDQLDFEQMNKHFDKDILYFNSQSTQCLLGGDQISTI